MHMEIKLTTLAIMEMQEDEHDRKDREIRTAASATNDRRSRCAPGQAPKAQEGTTSACTRQPPANKGCIYQGG